MARIGKDGRDGLNGKDGLNGRDGVDGKTPVFEVVETETVSSSEQADVLVEREGNNYKLKVKIPRGAAGHNGAKGKDGRDGIVKEEEITMEEYTIRYNAGTLDEDTIYHESLVI